MSAQLSKPKRIQRKRIKGWRMPEGAVSVTRPGEWGNPFAVGQHYMKGDSFFEAYGKYLDNTQYADTASVTAENCLLCTNMPSLCRVAAPTQMSTPQLSILELLDRPRSKRGQLSSQRAERQMKSSGAMKGQALIAFNLVKQFPGRSSKELAKLGTLDRYQLARRLSDLLHAEKVWRIENGEADCRWYAR